MMVELERLTEGTWEPLLGRCRGSWREQSFWDWGVGWGGGRVEKRFQGGGGWDGVLATGRESRSSEG